MKYKEKMEMLLSFSNTKHNHSAFMLFVLIKAFIKNENLYQNHYDRFLSEFNIIKNFRKKPMIFDKKKNEEFWNILNQF